MDEDLDTMDRAALLKEAKRPRSAIREHRDCSGYGLCWHDPKRWDLLPEKVQPNVAVPPWPKFMRGCVAYWESLDRQLPAATVADVEYDDADR